MNTARNRTVRRSEDLTPEARLERAKRQIADGLVDAFAAMLVLGSSDNEWVHQANSPLGRRKHLKLAKSGVFPSARREQHEVGGVVKKGRRWFVLRSEVNAYIGKGAPARVASTETEEVDDILATVVGGAKG